MYQSSDICVLIHLGSFLIFDQKLINRGWGGVGVGSDVYSGFERPLPGKLLQFLFLEYRETTFLNKRVDKF